MKPDYKLVAKARYIHMTADLAAEVWGECYKKFYPPKTLAALIDRLIHHSHIVIFSGESYRLTQSMNRQRTGTMW